MTGSQRLAVLAEDEPLLRMAAADMLCHFGFEVLEAEHADDALRYLEAREGVALLYTDVSMPGRRDGFALARRRPSAGRLFASSYAPVAYRRSQIRYPSERAL